MQPSDAASALRQRGLADAGHVLDEQVAAREQRDHREPDRLGLAADHAADVVLERPDQQMRIRNTALAGYRFQTFAHAAQYPAGSPPAANSR